MCILFFLFFSSPGAGRSRHRGLSLQPVRPRARQLGTNLRLRGETLRRDVPDLGQGEEEEEEEEALLLFVCVTAVVF